MPNLKMALLCLLLLPLTAGADQNQLIWQWQHHFSESDKTRHQRWITQVSNASVRLFGTLPFPVYLEIFSSEQHSDKDMGEPVPWARTLRQPERQALQLYLDNRYSDRQFLHDWTVPHEFSHLIFPYLGEQDSWLAEGFASYLQFMVMKEMGTIDQYTHQQRLIARIQKAEKEYYQHPAVRRFDSSRPPSFIDIAPLLKAQGKHPTMYWGGAVFFLQLDAKLQKQGGLRPVLKRYLKCCRLQTRSTQEVLATLDKLSFSRLFSETYQTFGTRTGFPEYRQAFKTVFAIRS